VRIAPRNKVMLGDIGLRKLLVIFIIVLPFGTEVAVLTTAYELHGRHVTCGRVARGII